jgi:hypothetical protein
MSAQLSQDISYSPAEGEARSGAFDGGSWSAAILGALPIVLSGFLYALQGFDYSQSFLPAEAMLLDFGLHLLLLVGVVFAWNRQFPRWSLSYVAVTLLFSLMLSTTHSSLHLFGRTVALQPWGWRAWAPLAGVILAMALVSRSLRPLLRLLTTMLRDWTRLSFLLYSGWVWLVLGAIYDSKTWYEQPLYLPLDVLIATFAFAGGAVAYLLARHNWQRVLALIVPLFVFMGLGAISQALQGSALDISYHLHGVPIWLALILLPAFFDFLFGRACGLRAAHRR